MKNTITAKVGYWIGKIPNQDKTDNRRVLLDGQNVVMLCELMPYELYKEEASDNECFEKCEVFTTQKGNQYIYWRDNELDKDYITKVSQTL